MGTLYSHDWAVSVLLEWHRAHSRATDLIMKVLGFSEKDLLLIVQTPGSSWNNFKQCVKIFENYLSSGGGSPENPANLPLLVSAWASYALRHGLARNKKVLDTLSSLV